MKKDVIVGEREYGDVYYEDGRFGEVYIIIKDVCEGYFIEG